MNQMENKDKEKDKNNISSNFLVFGRWQQTKTKDPRFVLHLGNL